MSSATTVPVEVINHIIVFKEYAAATWALTIYEHIITFDREFKNFWQRKFTFVSLLWFFNRYTVKISFFPTMLAFFIPLTDEQCTRLVKFPGAMQIVVNISSGITLALRVYALYGRAWWVIVVLLPVFIAEIGVESWAVANGVPAAFPPGIVGCVLTGKPHQGDLFAAFWIGQLVFPTLIFVMTTIRVLRLRNFGMLKGGLLNVMLRDGAMYFFVIFIANLTNVLTYSLAPPELQFINAPFTNAITTMMICRLMMNLRHASEGPSDSGFPSLGSVRVTTQPGISRFYIGDLGEELDVDSYERREARYRNRVSGLSVVKARAELDSSDELELSDLVASRIPTTIHTL